MGRSSWYPTFLASKSLVLTIFVEGISFKLGGAYVSVKAIDMELPACGGVFPLVANPFPAWPVKLISLFWEIWALGLTVSVGVDFSDIRPMLRYQSGKTKEWRALGTPWLITADSADFQGETLYHHCFLQSCVSWSSLGYSSPTAAA